MPGSPERVLAAASRTSRRRCIEATRERWGLDKPLFPDQFVAYVGSTLQGDLGFSFKSAASRSPRSSAQRVWPTLLLFGLGEVIAIVLGLALGAYSGWKRGGAVDHVGNGVSLILYSTPYFLLGMGLLHHLRRRRWAGSRPSGC